MTGQTRADLDHIEDIISQRIHELTCSKPSGIQGDTSRDAPTIYERLSLGGLHWFVRLLTR